MNKDKELEEAIETIKNSYVMSTKHCLDDENIQLKQSIETILQTLENSVPKKKIEDALETCKNVYKKEMKPYQTEYGLNVTYLSKKEKNELVNKRNCLITQMETYKQLLEDK